MEPDYHITRDTILVARPARNNLCIFCHFDAGAKISPQVVHYLKSLAEAGCDTVFISNCEAIGEGELEKILPYIVRIILRKNIGYDFACYFVGFMVARDSAYERIIFANDSVYGPFYPLTGIFAEMRASDPDIWSMTEALYPCYYLQSYFLSCKNTPRVMAVLERFFAGFTYTSDKEKIVGDYEYGLTRLLQESGLTTASFCSAEKLIALEKSDHGDARLLALKANIRQYAYKKKRTWKSLFFKKHKVKFAQKLETYTYLSPPQYCSWYSLIVYLRCPFLKTALVKSPRNFHYHMELWGETVARLYPSFKIPPF